MGGIVQGVDDAWLVLAVLYNTVQRVMTLGSGVHE